MKKSILSFIICSVVAFTFIGCNSANTSSNSNDKTTQKESNQDQNTESKSDTSTTDNKDKQSENNNDKSDVKNKSTVDDNKQSQGSNNTPNVTVNINGNSSSSEKKDVIVIHDPIPPNTAYGSFIFPNSDSSYLTKNQISNLNNFQLGIARNEIYARHGYIFSLEQFRTYFNAQSWYRPTTKNVTLNKIEVYNVELIKAEENRRGLIWR